MVIGFLGLMSNIPINYVFIHGKLGMPALGGVGYGVATGFSLLDNVSIAARLHAPGEHV